MNRLVQAQLNQINSAIAQIDGALKKSREFAAKQESTREDLQKQVWNRGKELAALQRSLREFEALQAENEGRKRIQADLNERLKRVLGYSKALSDSLQS